MSEKQGVTHEQMMGFLVDMDGRITDIAERMATKDDLEMLRQDIRDELSPISNAIDRDAKTIINHEKRITTLERKAGIILK